MYLSPIFRSHLLALGINLFFFLWAWLGNNNGKGLFFFTTDEIGLMFLLPLAMAANALCWIFALTTNSAQLMRSFAIIIFALTIVCIAIWIHGYCAGISI
jgi:hypothetical protein